MLPKNFDNILKYTAILCSRSVDRVSQSVTDVTLKMLPNTLPMLRLVIFMEILLLFGLVDIQVDKMDEN